MRVEGEGGPPGYGCFAGTYRGRRGGRRRYDATKLATAIPVPAAVMAAASRSGDEEDGAGVLPEGNGTMDVLSGPPGYPPGGGTEVRFELSLDVPFSVAVA